MRAKSWAAWLGAVGLIMGVPAVSAQDYPAREIRAICPFAPGTGADIVVRYYAMKLAELAGKPVVTENRPGAQGLLGTEAIAKAKPDGYTISINPAASTLAAASHIFKKLPFDPLKDFEFAGLILSVPFVLSVSPRESMRTLADLTRHLKEKKGEAFYGGSTNAGIVASELYKNAIGVDVKRVNYRSALDALNEMAAGNIDFYFTDATTALGQITAGRYRALAVTSAKRSSALADVPTMTELGVPMDFAPWWGVLAPAGTPKPIVDKIAGWFDKISAMPETKAFLIRNGLEPLSGDAATMRALLVKDIARWAEWVKLAQIEPQ
ncbi:MAG TPA: tripartite tricarboxylate transporter substrate-binding protein [Xanthobacteraceae bacterium]